MARADERINEHLAQRAQADVEAAPAPAPRPAVGTGAASSSGARPGPEEPLSLIHISEPTRLALI
eukprot:6268215-Alexandrium_andersonii.AAC.1